MTIDKKNSQLPHLEDSFTKEMVKGLCSKLSLPLHQQHSSPEAREGKGASRTPRDGAGAASAGGVCADFLSLSQSRVLAC